MIKLKLTDTQFAAIYFLLLNVRLGSRNIYEAALSDLMIDIEHDGGQHLYNKVSAYREPSLTVECSTEDGLVLNLV